MIEPITSALMAKAADASEADSNKVTEKLLIRLFGPLADEIGDTMARYARYRFRNVGRIVERADAKTHQSGSRGLINPRAAHVIMEQGSMCDDELMADYLGGVLAAGRSPTGRDDRAVTWSGLITRLSSFQVRAHFVIYREWAARLADMKINLANHSDLVTLYLEFGEFSRLVLGDSELDPEEVVVHSILGLSANELINPTAWAVGYKEEVKLFAHESPYDRVVMAQPSHQGIELYGWAQGFPGLNSANFTAKASTFDVDESIPRVSASIPRLDALVGTTTGDPT